MAEFPERIGKYTVKGEAGRGAMGVVYVGHDPFIDREVAIKVCNTDDEDEANRDLARRMFFNEAKSAGMLDHPNILRIYDAGESDGQPYIVMEYVPGADALNNYCKPDNLLPIDRVLRYMIQCAKALDYAHRREVLHRDIKPANVLLTEDGEAKLGDFGIAQRLAPGKTQLMSTYGSPRYMSPQQALDENLTIQADIYSLGVSLYELLTGRPPFIARGIGQLINMITSKDPPSLRSVRPEIPERLETIVARAMHKNLADRYQTAREFAEALAAVSEHVERRRAQPMTAEEKFARCRELQFFNEFSDSELTEVLSVGKWGEFRTGKKLIEEGKLEQSFFVLVSGEVAIGIGSQVITTVRAGECVGELGYLSKVQRTASVTALDDVTCLKIDALLMEWASLPCQMRFNKVFQKTLIERLSNTTIDLAKLKHSA